MNPSTIDIISAVIFAIALLHTFSTKSIAHLAHTFPKHAGLLHLLGEVEVVFGFWAFILVAIFAFMRGESYAVEYLESRHYTEPLFVFVVMVIAASRPILEAVSGIIMLITKLLPFRSSVAQTWLSLAAVPLIGSLITEPAAMTLAALLLLPLVFSQPMPEWKKYAMLGVLFVNVSIGGTLTSFAAPPVLMVAATWQWDSSFMLMHFGWKSAIAVLINATLATLFVSKDLGSESDEKLRPQSPLLVKTIHIAFLIGVVVFAHHPVIFLGLFLLFLGFTQAYANYQSPLILKEAMLVGFFLAGLVILGGQQEWWLQPLVTSLAPSQLFFGAVGLTAITDNAALTYLGSLIQGISNEAKYMLVAGAVAGGGLTLIANAPNPAGAALLRVGFEDETISIIQLLLGAIIPTIIAGTMLFFF